MMNSMAEEFDFRLLRLCCVWAAREAVVFGRGGAANDLRGALGLVLDPAWFRPSRDSGPSGLRDLPRPFVLRTPGDPQSLAPGGHWRFEVHLFDPEARSMLEQALRTVASSGMGRGRGKFVVESHEWSEVVVDLQPGEPARKVRVRFLTPTELKGFTAAEGPLPFSVLLARARDRISSLRAAYGGGPPALDFQGLGLRARQVQTTACSLQWQGGERRSTRTGQRHPLGGFTGMAEFEGDLGEFLPLLEAATWTGVGRQTTWGHGAISVERL
jgi:hypothetical protein